MTFFVPQVYRVRYPAQVWGVSRQFKWPVSPEYAEIAVTALQVSGNYQVLRKIDLKHDTRFTRRTVSNPRIGLCLAKYYNISTNVSTNNNNTSTSTNTSANLSEGEGENL